MKITWTTEIIPKGQEVYYKEMMRIVIGTVLQMSGKIKSAESVEINFIPTQFPENLLLMLTNTARQEAINTFGTLKVEDNVIQTMTERNLNLFKESTECFNIEIECDEV